MHYRQAVLADIPELTRVRLAVRENVLRTPGLVTDAAYQDYLTRRGRGWLAETAAGQVAGFAIADLRDHSIWALFVHPDFARQGVGKQLHRLMLDWYFAQTQQPVWLSTAPGTRAEEFYRRQGWQETGRTSSGEVRFELSAEQWWIADVSSRLYRLVNRVAQDILPFEAAVKWFAALPPEYQRWGLTQLGFYVHQSHPSPEIVQQATESATIRRSATPWALLRALPFNQALPKIVALRADEHPNAFAALLTLFRLADTHRRLTECQPDCSHDWHHLPPLEAGE